MLHASNIWKPLAVAAVASLALTGCAATQDTATTEVEDSTDSIMTDPQPIEENAEEETETVASQVSYTDAWVRWSEKSEVIGGMTGAYVSLTNEGTETITLSGAEIDRAAKVEVHEMVMGEDGMLMQEIDGGLVIEPGETAILEPGGNHLMILGITEPILAGDLLTMTLTFAEDSVPDLVIENMVAKPVEAGGEEYDSDDMDMDMDMDMEQ